jgi:single-strand DNA-binding protein
MSYHKVVLAGNVVRLPEMRFLPSGEAVTNFTVAVSYGFGEHKKTIWFNVSVFGKQAESCNTFLKKGSKCLVDGTIYPGDDGNPRTWEDKEGNPHATYEITAQTVRFLSSHDPESSDDIEVPF